MIARRTRAATALVAAAFIAAAVATTAAGAQSAADVRITQAAVSNFPDMAFVVSLAQKQPLRAAQLQVTENQNPVRDLSVAKPGAEGSGVVLLIDASDSMTGRPIAGAMAAARAFAARRNPGQRLALITFNSTTKVVLPLTADPVAITGALAQTPKLATGTHIYDALASASNVLRDSGVSSGSIVLLSDGKDVGSTIDQATAIAAARDAKARVFAVGLRSRQYSSDALTAIASGTSGTYAEASGAAALKQVYSDLGYTLSNEYLLKYRSLAGPNVRIRVTVQVRGIPGTARAAYTSNPLPASAPTRGLSTWDQIVRSTVTLIVIILLIVSMIGFAVFRLVYRRDRKLMRRIGQFVTLPEDDKAKQRQADVTAMLSSEERRTYSGRFGRVERLEAEIAIAGIETPLATIALLTGVGGLIFGVIVAIVLGSPVGLLTMFVAPFITNGVIKGRLSKVRRTFSDQLPDNLDVLASGLRSGHSFTGALAVCVDDAAEPAKREFRRVIADEQLGVPIDEALHVTAQRMESRDVVQIALVAKLQREAGTNAADVLDQVSDNVRARLELRRLIATLTAQGRLARWIVSLLPVVLFFAIYVLNPDYLSPLWQTTAGILGLIAAGIMIIVGSLVIKRIIEIEV